MIDLMIEMIKPIEEHETKFLKSEGRKNLILARLVSLGALAMATYFLAAIIMSVSYVITRNFIDTSVTFKFETIWTMFALCIMPLAVILKLNLNNRDFSYSRELIDFLKVIKYAKINFESFRFMGEVFLGIFYIVFSSYFTLIALVGFIPETVVSNLLNDGNTLMLSIFFVHAFIYMALSVFFYPENTLENKLIKLRREFWLWDITLAIVVIYFFGKINSKMNPIDYMYFCLSVLVSISRAINCYKQLKDIVKKFENELDGKREHAV